MSTFSVGHYWQRRHQSVIPSASYVYIQLIRPNSQIFRVEVNANGAGRAITVLSPTGTTWNPVNRDLSVDTDNEYTIFWIPINEAVNFPTQVLRFVMENRQNNLYRYRPSRDDLENRRIRAECYTPPHVRFIEVERPVYYQPGFPRIVRAGTNSSSVNFLWAIRWEIDVSSGYLIQEMDNRMSAQNCSGHTVPNSDVPHYWEAWQITGPNQFQPGAFDYWTIRLPLGTRGTWSKTGRVFWIPTLDPAWGFRLNQVSSALLLLSTTTPVPHLGTPILVRQIGGRWDGCSGSIMSSHQQMTPSIGI